MRLSEFVKNHRAEIDAAAMRHLIGTVFDGRTPATLPAFGANLPDDDARDAARAEWVISDGDLRKLARAEGVKHWKERPGRWRCL